MSDYVPPKFSPRQLNLQMVNCYTAIHDLKCHCEKPLKHIIQQILEQEPTLKPWLDSTTGDGGNQPTEKDTEDTGIEDLERLFAEDVDDATG